MKFKVGDKVRLTREAMVDNANLRFSPEEILWWEVEAIEDYEWGYCFVWQYHTRLERELELVPEEPEFKYGEEVEATDGSEWYRRIFITKLQGKIKNPYVCVGRNSDDLFKDWLEYAVGVYKGIRKLKPQLTRKEIAEKFWVIEDFTLVD